MGGGGVHAAAIGGARVRSSACPRGDRDCRARAGCPYRRAMAEPDFLRFASDATFAALAGGALLLLAAFAGLAERRRLRRKHIDAVGFMPWTTVFFWAMLALLIVLGLAVQLWT